MAFRVKIVPATAADKQEHNSHSTIMNSLQRSDPFAPVMEKQGEHQTNDPHAPKSGNGAHQGPASGESLFKAGKAKGSQTPPTVESTGDLTRTSFGSEIDAEAMFPSERSAGIYHGDLEDLVAPEDVFNSERQSRLNLNQGDSKSCAERRDTPRETKMDPSKLETRGDRKTDGVPSSSTPFFATAKASLDSREMASGMMDINSRSNAGANEPQGNSLASTINSELSTPPSHFGFTPAGSSRPSLYSAIGSLESCNESSLGKIRAQQKDFLRDFNRPNLIPAPTIATTRRASKESLSTTAAVETKKIPTATSSLKKEARQATVVDVEKELAASTTGTRKGVSKEENPSHQPDQTRLRHSDESRSQRRQSRKKGEKRVTIDSSALKKKTSRKPKEIFRPSSDAYTPRMEKKKIKYKPAEMRTPVQKMSTDMGTLQRPNFRDALRRVAMIIQQHVVKIERRMEAAGGTFEGDTLFRSSMQHVFSEEKYSTPKYKCTMVRIPMARPGMVYGMRRIYPKYIIPTEQEIYEFGHQLFSSVQLSSECSIVCLIYVERLMEVAKVPLLASTWRPIFMCGLLLASKVWQDLSSWNIEFASVYPQFSLDAINRLELEFLRKVKWDLFISSSLYAKYYFALRSILEKPDFRQRYNRMVGGVGAVDVSEALKIEEGSSRVKEEALNQLSCSM